MGPMDELRETLTKQGVTGIDDDQFDKGWREAHREVIKLLDDFAEKHSLIEGCPCRECQYWDRDARYCIEGIKVAGRETKPDFGCALGRLAARKDA
uniref:Uncharacterized protein n=1 Tax=viral metagenome TaxID=1070528 RepID=A0A6M3IKA1_9ZZZZ